MIGVSLSLWFERQGKCPVCKLLINVEANECPNCGHDLSGEEMAAMRSKVNAQFKRSAIFGFILASAFVFLVIVIS